MLLTVTSTRMNCSRYWTIHALNGACCHQTQVLKEVKKHLEQQLQEHFADRQVQTQLMRYVVPSLAEKACFGHLALRCFVSSVLYFECIERAKKQGTMHHFCADDLLPIVLDPIASYRNLDNMQPLREEISLTTTILETFNPEKANLSTYTKLCLKGWRNLKLFLLEHGVIDVTNWALLCDRTPSSLARILIDYPFPRSILAQSSFGFDELSDRHYFHTQAEVGAAVELLQCFHQVYRQQRLQETTSRKPYLPPTEKQLQEMGQQLHCSEASILSELLELAKKLRHYVLHLSKSSSNTPFVPASPQDEGAEWLHQHLSPYLQSAIQSVIQHRYQYLVRKDRSRKKKQAHQYLQALNLFFCHNQPMGEIALTLEVSQPTVSRLLDLSTLRSDVSLEILAQAPQDLIKKLGEFLS